MRYFKGVFVRVLPLLYWYSQFYGNPSPLSSAIADPVYLSRVVSCLFLRSSFLFDRDKLINHIYKLITTNKQKEENR